MNVCFYLQIVLVLKSLQMYETTRLTVSIQIFSHVLAYTNLCIANPILYNCFSENFRKAFRKVSIHIFHLIKHYICDGADDNVSKKRLLRTHNTLEFIIKYPSA